MKQWVKKWWNRARVLILDYQLRYYYHAYLHFMQVDINEVLDKPGMFPNRVILYKKLFNDALEKRLQFEPSTKWKRLS
jgi:hypothetical protein